ncbi:MAG: nucleic acid-binding protein [uncultured Candidatus Thioglobus sp.]|nr:MAG: nucleic acid-binding protein [uncultured Candidatus Thioglobus sp.]
MLDTCVISELIKPQPNRSVVSWLQSQTENDLYLSVLTFGEIEKGIEKAANEARKSKLKLWVEEDLKQRFKGRILAIDLDVCTKWGEIQARTELLGKPVPSIDGLIAISALVNNCIMVTRNVKDMQQSGVELFNPWEDEF